jgi:phosphopantetheinyl transferase
MAEDECMALDGLISNLLLPDLGQATVVVIEFDSIICPILSSFLSECERDECLQYRYAHDRVAAQTMRGLARLFGGVLTGIAPDQVRTIRDGSGRPGLMGVERSQYDFNVSRTRSCCAGVLSRGGRCGIDIEDVVAEEVSEELVGMLWASGDGLGKIEPCAEEYFRRWTQLESALKADGRGLGAGIEGIGDIPGLCWDDQKCRIDGKTWAIRPIQAPRGVVASCAVEDHRVSVVQVAQEEVESCIRTRSLCARDE